MGYDFRMPLEEAMETQRAIRRLKTDPVDDEILRRVIELALKAPTGSNAQNWEFIVVRDPEVKRRLARLNRQAWRLYGGLGRRFNRVGPQELAAGCLTHGLLHGIAQLERTDTQWVVNPDHRRPRVLTDRRHLLPGQIHIHEDRVQRLSGETSLLLHVPARAQSFHDV